MVNLKAYAREAFGSRRGAFESESGRRWGPLGKVGNLGIGGSVGVVPGYVLELWDPKFISEPSAHCHFKDLHIVKDVVLDLSWEHEL